MKNAALFVGGVQPNEEMAQSIEVIRGELEAHGRAGADREAEWKNAAPA
jgi:hypothetical protein